MIPVAALGWLDRLFLPAVLYSSLAAIVVLVLQPFLRRTLDAFWRHTVWIVVLAASILPLVVPVSLRPALPRTNPVVNAVSVNRVVEDRIVAAFPHRESSVAVHPSGRIIRSAVAVVWLSGILYLAIRLLFQIASAYHISSFRPVTRSRLLNLLEDCREEMGLRTPVWVVESEGIRSPMVLGFIRPRLLLPKGLFDSFPREKMRLVLMHELSHIKRSDILVNWFAVFVNLVYWFNPLVYLAVRSVRRESEFLCDAMVLRHARTGAGRKRLYGDAILDLLERYSEPGLLAGAAGIVENKGQIELRLRRILHGEVASRPAALVGTLLVALLGLSAIVNGLTIGETAQGPGFWAASWIDKGGRSSVLSDSSQHILTTRRENAGLSVESGPVRDAVVLFGDSVPDGRDSLRIDFNLIRERDAGGNWGWVSFLLMGNNPWPGADLDVRGCDAVRLDVKGARGGETIQLTISDAKSAAPSSVEVSSYLPTGRVTRNWQTAVIPISAFRPGRKFDLSRVHGIGGNLGPEGKQSVYLDNIRFERHQR